MIFTKMGKKIKNEWYAFQMHRIIKRRNSARCQGRFNYHAPAFYVMYIARRKFILKNKTKQKNQTKTIQQTNVSFCDITIMIKIDSNGRLIYCQRSQYPELRIVFTTTVLFP